MLRLTDSVEDAAVARTLDEYVVTPALAEAFDVALGLVAEAMTSGVSRGAFLSGSFGSGKSHFMAVLYALLRHNPAARAKAELQPVIARHDDVLLDKNVLPLAFHLLGAESLEQALFSGYIRQIAPLHPDATLPAVHQSDGILADAERLRARDGDERFFAGLNGGQGAGGRPVVQAAGRAAPGPPSPMRPRGPRRQGRNRASGSVTALVEHYFNAYTQQAGYVDLDTGLAAITAHAKGLGYDAVVLFLDELVLWLAFSVQDREFFRRESQKLTKLVESATGARAIPLVSFVARQMDLRRWFADAGASGAEQEALDRAFRHQEGRFGTIVLGDDNLPYVANRRLLRRRAGQPARRAGTAGRVRAAGPPLGHLGRAARRHQHRRPAPRRRRGGVPAHLPVLAGPGLDAADAGQRHAAGADRAEGHAADARRPAGRAHRGRCRPGGGLLRLHRAGQPGPRPASRRAVPVRPCAVPGEAAADPAARKTASARTTCADPDRAPAGFRADDRLAKTLLLSAVAPKVPALKELTASRLASLNHGSIKSPLPGSEASIVLAKVKEWARRVPEIHVGGDPRNPVIRVQLSDVDYESVVENAKGEDNEGRRRELIKDLVREALGRHRRRPGRLRRYTHPVIWRGSRRSVDLVFGNVRDARWLTDDHFRARPGTWRIVIDHPFDQAGHSAAEDLGGSTG